MGLRLSRIDFVREAIDSNADLSAFKKPPTLRIIVGMFAIAFSFAMCWPVISALGGLSVYYRQPLIVGIGGPVIYFMSHGCFILGIMLTGTVHMQIILRWAARKGVQKLLAAGA